jgi:hypothetical protein
MYREKGADKTLLTHCRRELFHAVWELILDDEFLEAYDFGIVLKFPDGTERRVFLRFLSYSADYPEKWHFFEIQRCIAYACIQDSHRSNPRSWGMPLPTMLDNHANG